MLGSGSGGNATLVATERTRVLVDAGLSRRETFRRLKGLGESPAALDAILISHEHTDHIGGMLSLASALRIPAYLTALTRQAIPLHEDGEEAPAASPRGGTECAPPRFEIFRAGHRFAIQDLEVEPFTVPHDATDPVAFCFSANAVRVGVCIDLGYLPDSVKVHLRGCRCLVLESNHDLDMLKVGPYPWAVKQRVMSRTGHLSNSAVAEFLENDFDGAAQVLVLAHLSENNNHPEIARLSATMALEASQGSGNQTRLVISSQNSPTELFRF